MAFFEKAQVKSSVKAEGVLEFFADHGLFYQENAEIGKPVDDLYNTNRVRSEDARLEYFMSTLQKDSVSAHIHRYNSYLPTHIQSD